MHVVSKNKLSGSVLELYLLADEVAYQYPVDWSYEQIILNELYKAVTEDSDV